MNVEVYLVMWLNVLMSDQFIVIEQTSINVCPNVGVGLGGRKNAPMCSFTIKMVRMCLSLQCRHQEKQSVQNQKQ